MHTLNGALARETLRATASAAALWPVLPTCPLSAMLPCPTDARSDAPVKAESAASRCWSAACSASSDSILFTTWVTAPTMFASAAAAGRWALVLVTPERATTPLAAATLMVAPSNPRSAASRRITTRRSLASCCLPWVQPASASNGTVNAQNVAVRRRRRQLTRLP